MSPNTRGLIVYLILVIPAPSRIFKHTRSFKDSCLGKLQSFISVLAIV